MSNLRYLYADDYYPTLAEGELIDPYFDHGRFFVVAPLGQRGRIRNNIRDLASTHAPSLQVFVNAGSFVQNTRGRLYVEAA